MQKSEKTAEPSMEEILASIRKIIAEEPPQAPQQPAVPPAAVAQPDVARKASLETAHPPGDDLSDILEEPSSDAKVEEATESSGAEPDAENAPFSPAAPEAELTRPSAQSIDDASQESPLMARLRGLAGAPNSLTQEPSRAPESNELGLTEQDSEPGRPELQAPTVASPEPSKIEAALAARPSADAELSAELEESKTPDRPASTEGAASIFGKSAAAGVDPIAISITSEEASSAIIDVAQPGPVEADLKPTSTISETESAFEQLERSAPAAVDNVFASLTEAPIVEEVAEPQDQPVLPHQELAGSQAQQPLEDTVPEPSVPTPTSAEADKLDAIKEKAPPGDVGQRADLEVALAALMEPMVDRWLTENVPSIVERVLAEKMNDK